MAPRSALDTAVDREEGSVELPVSIAKSGYVRKRPGRRGRRNVETVNIAAQRKAIRATATQPLDDDESLVMEIEMTEDGKPVDPKLLGVAQLLSHVPTNRSECVNGIRPCPFARCKHHLYLDVNSETGSIKLNFPDLDLWEMRETCALDVADRGGMILEEVGDILNVSRARIQQIESKSIEKARETARALGLDHFLAFLDGQVTANDGSFFPNTAIDGEEE